MSATATPHDTAWLDLRETVAPARQTVPGDWRHNSKLKDARRKQGKSQRAARRANRVSGSMVRTGGRPR